MRKFILLILLLSVCLSCKQTQDNKSISTFTALILSTKTYYNTPQIQLYIEFTESIKQISLDDIKVIKGNAILSNLVRINEKKFTFNLMFTSKGSVRIRMEEGGVLNHYDEIAKRSKIFEFVYDNEAPIPVLTLNQSVHNTSDFKVNVNFTEDIEGLTIQDFVTTNASIKSLTTISKKEYILELMSSSEGESAVQLLSTTVKDIADNSNPSSNIVRPTYCQKCRVLGQDDFDTINLKKDLKYALHGPKGSFVGHGKFIVADTENHRVLIWNTVPNTALKTPDVILGQSDINKVAANGGNTVNSKGLYKPHSVFYDGTRLFVTDTGNHRVLIWNTLPTTNNVAANIVLGQTNFTSAQPGVSINQLNSPQDLLVQGNKVFIADTNNHRVLVWNSLPTFNGQNSSFVLGQINFANNSPNAGGLNASSFNTPTGVSTDGTRLFVADSQNNRVLIWNTYPSINYAASNLVIGQSLMTTNTDNNGGLSASSLSKPYSVRYANSQLLVGDSGNHRVLAWTTTPSTNFAAASFAIGQTNLITDTYNPDALTKRKVAADSHFSADTNNVFIPSAINNRVLQWKVIPSGNDFPADNYFGQYTFESNSANLGTSADNVFLRPGKTFFDGQRLFLVDTKNHRVLIWNNLPNANNVKADVVVGQEDMTSALKNANGLSGKSLNSPSDVYSDGTKLYIVDKGNNRVLIWNSIPLTNFISADFALGQPNLTTATVNTGGLSSQSLNSPTSLIRIYNKIIVSDTGNHRLLIWNQLPNTNQQVSNYVIGQSNMTSSGANNGGIGANTLNEPTYLATDGIKLIVADKSNHRALIWETVPLNNGANANHVIGQPNFTESTSNHSGLSNKSLGVINDITCGKSNKLYISTDSRILEWSAVPDEDFSASQNVYGQLNSTFMQPNFEGLTYRSIGAKSYITTTDDKLLISDTENSRLIMLPLK